MSDDDSSGAKARRAYEHEQRQRDAEREDARATNVVDGRGWLATEVGCRREDLHPKTNEPWHDGRHLTFGHADGTVDVYLTGVRGYSAGAERSRSLQAVWSGGESAADLAADAEVRWD
jgi:hypothetical protein